MPIHANRIVFGEDPEEPDDYFAFEDMPGVLHPMTEKMEIFARRGHQGETFRKTGIRAIPSQIVTVHFVLDFEAAADALVSYGTLIDGNPYQVIQHSLNYGYFRVLEVVQLPETRAVFPVAGNTLIANPTVVQYCGWTLIATNPPE